MTFAVRTISRSATGADIVHRPQRFETNELVIGRGGACEIRLVDLAVTLRHAVLRRTGPGKVSITSIGTDMFAVDGKVTTKADLDLSDTPQLKFGSHLLTLSQSPDEDVVLVDVNRLETAPEDAAASNEKKIFSLTGSGLGKRPVAWTLALIGLALCLFLPMAAFFTQTNRHIHADQQWSTGPLSKSHAFLSKNCQACHVKAFVSVKDETCLACHQKTSMPRAAELVAAKNESWGGPTKVALIQEHADHDLLVRAAPLPTDPVGRIQALFRRQFNHPNDRCASCHLEHLADAPAKGTATQTPPRPRALPVLKTVYTCAECHDKLRERLGTTALRDTPDWRHHPEFRPLTARTPMGLSAPRLTRISLVEHPSDYSGLIFSHQEHLSTTGGVARMAAGLRYAGGALACADCHRPNKTKDGFEPVEMTKDCSGCHSLAYAPGGGDGARVLPHAEPDKVVATLKAFYATGGLRETPAGPRKAPGFLDRLGMMFSGHAARGPVSGADSKIRALFEPRGLCVECHALSPRSDAAALSFKIIPINQTQRYLPWGAFNHDLPAHKQDAAGKPTCESCHAATTTAGTNELMLPRIESCAACHGKTKAKLATAASAECAECHSYHAPGMASPKVEHAKTDGGQPATAPAQTTAQLSRPAQAPGPLASTEVSRRAY